MEYDYTTTLRQTDSSVTLSGYVTASCPPGSQVRDGSWELQDGFENNSLEKVDNDHTIILSRSEYWYGPCNEETYWDWTSEKVKGCKKTVRVITEAPKYTASFVQPVDGSILQKLTDTSTQGISVRINSSNLVGITDNILTTSADFYLILPNDEQELIASNVIKNSTDALLAYEWNYSNAPTGAINDDFKLRCDLTISNGTCSVHPEIEPITIHILDAVNYILTVRGSESYCDSKPSWVLTLTKNGVDITSSVRFQYSNDGNSWTNITLGVNNTYTASTTETVPYYEQKWFRATDNNGKVLATNNGVAKGYKYEIYFVEQGEYDTWNKIISSYGPAAPVVESIIFDPDTNTVQSSRCFALYLSEKTSQGTIIGSRVEVQDPQHEFDIDVDMEGKCTFDYTIIADGVFRIDFTRTQYTYFLYTNKRITLTHDCVTTPCQYVISSSVYTCGGVERIQ